jgi:RluA family pseudouridine synthase
MASPCFPQNRIVLVPGGRHIVEMPDVSNISCYQFAPLEDLKPLRSRLLLLGKELGLKGTVLLSMEGINFFIAGARENVDRFVEELRKVPGLENIRPKFSPSKSQPFTRMLVKIKKEIIAFGVEGIDPSRAPSPKLAPATLKQWLDEGREVTMLDTRNDYEIKLGTFEGAIDLGIDHFRQFPEAVKSLPDQLKDSPVVMFCTGGIRCEKAGPFMQRAGFNKIYQLDGGILKYFEECGGAHYRGECFVFDHRVGVDPGLQESSVSQCFVCQSLLTPEALADPRFVIGKSCPACFQDPSISRQQAISQREKILKTLTNPLPGSLAYEHVRPVIVPQDFHGSTLLDFLASVFPRLSRAEWKSLCDEGRLTTTERVPCTAEHQIFQGERYTQHTPAHLEPSVNADIRILHEDEALVVINKPAPLPMHPCGRFYKNTLQWILCEAYKPHSLRPAHRLDAQTTGVSVWTRSRHFARLVQKQFAENLVKKSYLARVHGEPSAEEFSCHSPIATEPGHSGFRQAEPAGQNARTDFRVLKQFGDGTSLLEAVPVTGRTNQIRIHLQTLGFPIYGDPVYAKETIPEEALLGSDSQVCLHSHRISLIHPIDNTGITFEAAAPNWAAV